MKTTPVNPETTAIFETKPIPSALWKMALPTVVSRLITLIVWTQTVADAVNVVISYVIYSRMIGRTP